MAARVFLQKRAAPWAATMVLGAVALAPATVLAEAPDSLSRKKPIYDDFDFVPAKATLPPSNTVAVADQAAELDTVPVPAVAAAIPAPHDQQQQEPPQKAHGPSPTDRLAVEIGKGRLFLYRQALRAEDAVNRTMDRAFDLEQSFTNTIASLAPPRESGEKLMPGAVYVLVAAMAGSIITRRSNILFRAAAPVALGVGTGWAVLPLTMTNVSNLAWKYEQRFPAVADGHLKFREGIQNSISFARVHTDIGVRYVDEKVTDARETVESWVRKGQ